MGGPKKHWIYQNVRWEGTFFKYPFLTVNYVYLYKYLILDIIQQNCINACTILYCLPSFTDRNNTYANLLIKHFLFCLQYERYFHNCTNTTNKTNHCYKNYRNMWTMKTGKWNWKVTNRQNECKLSLIHI